MTTKRWMALLALISLSLVAHYYIALRGHKEWVAKCLKEMQSVEVGMTRKDLNKALRYEVGGLFTYASGRWVHPECPYFKVNVELAASNLPKDTDKITQISQPYLEWVITD